MVSVACFFVCLDKRRGQLEQPAKRGIVLNPVSSLTSRVDYLT